MIQIIEAVGPAHAKSGCCRHRGTSAMKLHELLVVHQDHILHSTMQPFAALSAIHGVVAVVAVQRHGRFAVIAVAAVGIPRPVSAATSFAAKDRFAGFGQFRGLCQSIRIVKIVVGLIRVLTLKRYIDRRHGLKVLKFS